LQLRKTEQNCTNDVDKKVEPLCTARDETEDMECEESSIVDISQNIASKMAIADSETLTKPEGKSKESGAKLDIQNGLPEVLILDAQSYDTAFIFAHLFNTEFLQLSR
jgi:hypothetical protein